MKRKVAIEDSLTNISNYLRNQGLQVSNLSNERNFDSCDAVIISGQDENFMGMNDTATKTMVINAVGKTPEDIYNHINNNIK